MAKGVSEKQNSMESKKPGKKPEKSGFVTGNGKINPRGRETREKHGKIRKKREKQGKGEGIEGGAPCWPSMQSSPCFGGKEGKNGIRDRIPGLSRISPPPHPGGSGGTGRNWEKRDFPPPEGDFKGFSPVSPTPRRNFPSSLFPPVFPIPGPNPPGKNPRERGVGKGTHFSPEIRDRKSVV